MQISRMKAGTKSLIFFLIIYLFSTAILGGIIGYFYYQSEKERIIKDMRVGMQYKAEDINSKLAYYHLSDQKEFVFAEDGYDIALYNNQEQRIASTLSHADIDLSKFFYNKDEMYYLIETLNKQYLGIKYIVIMKEFPKEALQKVISQMSIFALVAIAFLVFIAILLSKIMLYPLQNLIDALKTFIKNSTHEMNTPISTILMTYEHFDKENLKPKQLRSLDRIEIATKTLSNLYNDLTYISFHEHIAYEKNAIDVKVVLEERLKYIDTFMRFKGITLKSDLHSVICHIDQRKLTLILDNLLSNAIKFSKQDGKIDVTLTEACLCVKDHGVGIEKKKQKTIFKRFETSNGFGVGLDIVSEICKEHHIKITVDSEVSKGSEFRLIWPKIK